MDYLFFKTGIAAPAAVPEAGADLTLSCWRPTLRRPVRRDLPAVPFAAWSLFHFLRIFATRDYFILLIAHGSEVVHRTCVFPAHFRFPFMAERDLQAAGLWTAPEWRGRGLGLTALREALRRVDSPERTLWYMVREDNRPSIRLAQKAGLLLWGRGRRVDPWGIGVLGRYQVTEILH